MSLTIKIKHKHMMGPEETAAMYRLRHQVFLERLGWQVEATGGLEFDKFDELSPIYMLATDDVTGSVYGCARLLPTTGTYMLKDVFGVLLHGRAAPRGDDIWEFSRFAVAQKHDRLHHCSRASSYMIIEALAFALSNGIRQYVGVTTVGFEKLLKKSGLEVKRFGPPTLVGHERSVGFYIDVTPAQLAAVRSVTLEQFQRDTLGDTLGGTRPDAGIVQRHLSERIPQFEAH
jgi:acyl homoserine lactone synthase